MKRLVGGFAAAVMLAAGVSVVQPARVSAQNPTMDCQTCRIAFTTCMRTARTPTEAAACRAAAVTCLKACTAS